MISKLTKLFEEIANQKGTGSKNRKKELVKANDSELLRLVLRTNFDPTITTNLKKRKLNKQIKKVVAVDYKIKDLEDFCLYLASDNCTGKDKDIVIVREFISQFPEAEQDFLSKLACKELKMGLAEKEINKVLGAEFILVPKAMKGKTLNEARMKKCLNKRFSLEKKYDGQRATLENEKFLSYNRLEYKGLNELLEECKAYLPIDDYVVDGELIYIDDTAKMDRKAVRRKTATILGSDDPDKKNIGFIIFSLIPKEDWEKEKSKLTYRQRRDFLESLSLNSSMLLSTSEVLYTGDNIDVVGDLSRQVYKEGLEGLILYLENEPYVFKKGESFYKIKEWDTLDLVITKANEGEGEFEGTLGSFTVIYRGQHVNVGGGYSKRQRDFLWENKNKYIGKLMEVKHLGESMDKEGNYSLTSPIFETMRNDKNIPDR